MSKFTMHISNSAGWERGDENIEHYCNDWETQ